MVNAVPARLDWRTRSGLLTLFVMVVTVGSILGCGFAAHAQRATPQTQQKFHTHYARVLPFAPSGHTKRPGAHTFL